jgi:hypothetical protein
MTQKIKVTIILPTGKYCNSCPLLDNGANYEYAARCNYLSILLDIDIDKKSPEALKDKKCPAYKREET